MRKFGHMNPELTTGEVAQHMGISRRTIQRLIQAGELRPTRKLPGQTGAMLFDAGDVIRLAAKQAQAKPARSSTDPTKVPTEPEAVAA
jgi:excisionase family DNA binding protein